MREAPTVRPWMAQPKPPGSDGLSTKSSLRSPSRSGISAHLFQQSENVKVHKSSINAPSGDYVVQNFVTHHHPPPIIQQNLDQGQDSNDLDNHEKADFEIYFEKFCRKGRGCPLWVPGPALDLPPQYRIEGISPGDVGILYKSGGFSFLFNVFLPADHPINKGRVPASFSPFQSAHLANDCDRFPLYNSGSFIASTTVHNKTGSDSTEMIFETSTGEGALLVMPDGAVSVDFRNIKALRKYMADNIELWYSYVVNDRGRDVNNGDIRLVTGFDKVPTWGIATFSNRQRTLMFQAPDVSNASQERRWVIGNGRHGPLDHEHVDLRAAGYNIPTFWNQTIFLRALNATLHPDTWRQLDFEDVSAHDSKCEQKNRPIHNQAPARALKRKDPPLTQDPRSRPSKLPVRMKSPPTSPKPSQGPGSGRHQKPAVKIGMEGQDTPFDRHPAASLNEFLVDSVLPHSTAKAIITHDLDWIGTLNEDSPASPNQASSSCFDVLTIDGYMYLEDTAKLSQTSDASSSPTTIGRISLELAQDAESGLEVARFGDRIKLDWLSSDLTEDHVGQEPLMSLISEAPLQELQTLNLEQLANSSVRVVTLPQMPHSSPTLARRSFVEDMLSRAEGVLPDVHLDQMLKSQVLQGSDASLAQSATQKVEALPLEPLGSTASSRIELLGISRIPSDLMTSALAAAGLRPPRFSSLRTPTLGVATYNPETTLTVHPEEDVSSPQTLSDVNLEPEPLLSASPSTDPVKEGVTSQTGRSSKWRSMCPKPSHHWHTFVDVEEGWSSLAPLPLDTQDTWEIPAATHTSMSERRRSTLHKLSSIPSHLKDWAVANEPHLRSMRPTCFSLFDSAELAY